MLEQQQKEIAQEKKPEPTNRHAGDEYGRTQRQPVDKTQGSSKTLASGKTGDKEDGNLSTSSAGPRKSGAFEEVDLSDPPTAAEKEGFEVVEHSDAHYSSHNQQADHTYKYPEGFGKDQKGGPR